MTFYRAVARHRHLLVPLACLSLIAVLIVPLPPFLMDLLICANISLAAVILMTTIYMSRPLDFSVFPSLLLGTTLFRLVLNVASTRLILTADAPTPQQAEFVAGHVIRSFGDFVAGNSQVVGIIIFLILIVVQFVVITKGATRMSEVAARFTLDAMPGKQMAIDADLSAGLIDEPEARARRTQVVREADFYGAMDGASKFVRGDAIAGVIITLVNIAGGFAIGIFDKGWTMSESLSVFTMLTIGDGLVSQIPAFIIAIAAALIVSRASERHTLGEAIPAQLVAQPIALYLIAGFLGVLAFTPLPTIPLLAGAGVLGCVAWGIGDAARQKTVLREVESEQEAASKKPDQPAVEDLLRVDAMEIEIGYGLVPLVDAASGGDLLERIGLIRRQLAAQIGIVVPPIRIRDNMALEPNEYRVKLRGPVVGRGVAHPDLLLAINPGGAEHLAGLPGRDPAFGLEAVWIEPAQRQRAESLRYTVVEPAEVLVTHLSEVIAGHADELLTREEVNHLIEELRKKSPKLVEEAIPAVIKPGEVQKVLQALVRERVPIRDIESIIETLADCAPQTRDVDVLTEYARNALRRTISGMHAVRDGAGRETLFCITLDPATEEVISGYIERGIAGTTFTIPPSVGAGIARAIEQASAELVARGRQLIILTSPRVRAQVRQICAGRLPGATVLSYNEVVSEVRVESLGMVEFADQQTGLGQFARSDRREFEYEVAN